jgi:class 3 adenylate cyclase
MSSRHERRPEVVGRNWPGPICRRLRWGAAPPRRPRPRSGPEANDIEMDLLKDVDDRTLKDIGVTSAGHRLRLRNAIAKLACTFDVKANASAVAAPEIAAPSGERRQLTVMFCDLVGSTALSEKLDPEELRSLLHAYRSLCGEVIARYDGFVARYVGDGILTYFGWPTAHEEDAERAVRAALV